MHLIRYAVRTADFSLPEVPVVLDRRVLAKRRWRAAAADGTDFGYEGDEALRDGDCIFTTAAGRYVLRQAPEPLLEIPLDVAADAAAVIGWAVGNLHFPLEAQRTRVLAPDDPALRQTLDRMGIHYHLTTEVFRPDRFTGTLAGHGHHHPHDPGHAHG